MCIKSHNILVIYNKKLINLPMIHTSSNTKFQIKNLTSDKNTEAGFLKKKILANILGKEIRK